MSTPTKAVSAAARALGKLGGKARAAVLSEEERQRIAQRGGKARTRKLTKERRQEIAREGGRAAKKRWKRLSADERAAVVDRMLAARGVTTARTGQAPTRRTKRTRA